jgi:hypothetical protein
MGPVDSLLCSHGPVNSKVLCNFATSCFLFYDEELLAPRPTYKLEDYPLSAVREKESVITHYLQNFICSFTLFSTGCICNLLIVYNFIHWYISFKFHLCGCIILRLHYPKFTPHNNGTATVLKLFKFHRLPNN